jgi:excisionase family DNA binding protein
MQLAESPEIEPLIGIRDAASVLGLSEDTIYRWVERGELPFIRLGTRQIRFRLSDLESWIISRTEGGAA